MHEPRRGRLPTALAALALALLALLAARAVRPTRWYAAHGAYRAQVDALLDGRLALTPAPEGLAHDLAWTPSGVQQVWGLGAPLWQLPFEAAARLVGAGPFPDRVALWLWLALGVYAVARGLGRPPWWRAAGVVLLTALLPPVVTVLRGRIGVYEEAALYAWTSAMILLGGVAGLARAPARGRYLALVAFAGATGLVRPTVWFYGLATLVVASALLLRARGRRALPTVAVGAALFVAGGAALYATNARRFGAGGEFGHRLNLASLPGNLVATRFDHPFAHAPLGVAAAELVGALVDHPERRATRGFYERGLHRGQADLPRWREYYFTAFGWEYLPGVLAGLVVAVRAWRRRPGGGAPATDAADATDATDAADAVDATDATDATDAAVARALGGWALLGAAPLVAFYLRAPSLSSRYLLDLGPALAASLVLAWLEVARRARPRIAVALVALPWLAAVATAKVSRPRIGSEPVGPAAAAAATYALSRPTPYERALPPGLDLDDPWLPLATDVLTGFDRCADLDGRPVPCDAPALDGDLRAHGDRPATVRGAPATAWTATAARVTPPGPTDEPAACAPAPPTCAPAPVATEPAGGAAPPPPLYLNGVGWDLATGGLPPATFFYVQDARFVELDVAALAPPAARPWADLVRVNVGPRHLRLVAGASTATGARLRFEPDAPLPPGLDVAFVAAGPIGQLDQPRTDLALRRIRWR